PRRPRRPQPFPYTTLLRSGHFLTLDMALCVFMSASVFAFAVAQSDPAGDAERRRWMLLAWAAAALAVLSKGLVGIVLPAGAAALDRKSTRLNSSHPILSYA